MVSELRGSLSISTKLFKGREDDVFCLASDVTEITARRRESAGKGQGHGETEQVT